MKIPDWAQITAILLAIFGPLLTFMLGRRKSTKIDEPASLSDREARFSERLVHRIAALEAQDAVREVKLKECEDRHTECEKRVSALEDKLTAHIESVAK